MRALSWVSQHVRPGAPLRHLTWALSSPPGARFSLHPDGSVQLPPEPAEGLLLHQHPVQTGDGVQQVPAPLCFRGFGDTSRSPPPQAGVRVLALQSVFEESLPRPSLDAVRGEMLPSCFVLQPVRRGGREATMVIYLLQVRLSSTGDTRRECAQRSCVFMLLGLSVSRWIWGLHLSRRGCWTLLSGDRRLSWPIWTSSWLHKSAAST